MNAKQFQSHLLSFYRFGVFGYFKMNFTKVFSRGKEFGLYVPGLRQKVFLRKSSSDQNVFDQIFVEQGYAPAFLEGFSPNVIVDAGAYTGLSTVYFANRHPDALVVAVEPEPSNFAMLEKNTQGYENVRCVRAALWNRKTELRMASVGRAWSARVEEGADEKHTVPSVTIPDLMEQFGFSAIDLLKIDIEGAEKELFSETYESWIGKCRVVVIEFHERFAPGCSKAFYSAIAPFAFRQYVRRENIFIDLRNNPV